jgi:putative nucleotidyltransferase with HDIG domain
LRALWEHSTEVAAIAHALATQFTKLKSDQALLAGLVHDIGSLPILSRAEDIPELLNDEVMLDRIIQKAHTTVGEAILSKWNFSEEIIAVAAEHENLERDHSGAADYVDLVMVANLQSHLGSDHPHTQQDWSKVPAFSKLGLEPDTSVVDMDETNEAIQAARQALAS